MPAGSAKGNTWSVGLWCFWFCRFWILLRHISSNTSTRHHSPFRLVSVSILCLGFPRLCWSCNSHLQYLYWWVRCENWCAYEELKQTREHLWSREIQPSPDDSMAANRALAGRRRKRTAWRSLGANSWKHVVERTTIYNNPCTIHDTHHTWSKDDANKSANPNPTRMHGRLQRSEESSDKALRGWLKPMFGVETAETLKRTHMSTVFLQCFQKRVWVWWICATWHPTWSPTSLLHLARRRNGNKWGIRWQDHDYLEHWVKSTTLFEYHFNLEFLECLGSSDLLARPSSTIGSEMAMSS